MPNIHEALGSVKVIFQYSLGLLTDLGVMSPTTSRSWSQADGPSRTVAGLVYSTQHQPEASLSRSSQHQVSVAWGESPCLEPQVSSSIPVSKRQGPAWTV